MNKETEHDRAETNEDADKNWAHDQQKHSYYYDDSHGYEIYNPDEDDEDDEEIKSQTTIDNSGQ